MADARVDQIHLADVALVLLKRRDFLRVRRPHEDWPIAASPSGVVGGIAEILHAVLRQLRLLAGCDIAHPEVPVANERGLLLVRRRDVFAGRPGRGSLLWRRLALGQVARDLGARRRIHQKRLLAVLRPGAIPEAIAGDPRRPDAAVQHERRRVVGHELLGAGVVLGGKDPERHPLLLGHEAAGERDQQDGAGRQTKSSGAIGGHINGL